MTPKEKAEELINKHRIILIQSDTDAGEEIICTTIAKQCAIIAVETEYNSLREQLLNLRSCHVIENEKVYLARIDLLNQEESQVKTEIESL